MSLVRSSGRISGPKRPIFNEKQSYIAPLFRPFFGQKPCFNCPFLSLWKIIQKSKHTLKTFPM